MTRLSDEEIIEHILGSMWNSERATGVKDTFVKQCVIMSYRLAEEKLQGEIESLSQSNLSLKQLAQGMAEKSNKEIERLTNENTLLRNKINTAIEMTQAIRQSNNHLSQEEG